MMRLPIPVQELGAGCNFAAATFLLDLISFPIIVQRPGGSGVRFKAVLEKYYPWDMEPVGGFDAKIGSKVLYDIFRNPLVHALGLSRERMAIGIRISRRPACIFRAVRRASKRRTSRSNDNGLSGRR
jgi:hypothetical protein